ncbi:MAG: hypothetical protein K6T17_08645 [Fimbriimonadales bacterium]|nr:hypothetical protein [Fimbriimonadales bacterium]
MRDKPAWVWILLVAGIAVLGLLMINLVVVLWDRRPDEERIRAVLESMRQASLEGKPGGVLEWVSQSFQTPIGDLEEYRSPRAALADALRRSDVESLTLKGVEVEVAGDAARVRCEVDARISYMGREITFNGPLELEFRREIHRRLWVIPEGRWMVVSAHTDPGRVEVGY